ncbi:hypothetical protein JKF63_01391 [Porcisia hertigi]|uniref:Uncharacterized protein n=1 Tax=Porcisia hertigi TaxID=2761500 RepID=A0A836HGF3_9TRYP|nr:hypothetical protein JKF63_01391 [Porcisia hertigi]
MFFFSGEKRVTLLQPLFPLSQAGNCTRRRAAIISLLETFDGVNVQKYQGSDVTGRRSREYFLRNQKAFEDRSPLLRQECSRPRLLPRSSGPGCRWYTQLAQFDVLSCSAARYDGCRGAVQGGSA